MERFKFRAFLTINGYDVNGADKEYHVLVYNIALYSDGGIGFSWDNFIEAVNRTNYSDEEKEKIIDELENEQCWNDEWCNYWGKIEQCVGIYDSNKVLIYEGDIVRATDPENPSNYSDFVVYWNNNDSMFKYKQIKFVGYDESGDVVKVIGNIHEEKKC